MRSLAHVLSVLFLGAGLFGSAAQAAQNPAAAPAAAAVVTTYANIAHAMYEASLAAARTLQAATNACLAAPTAPRLEAARTAWRAARVPYQQTEGLRFGNAAVDDWETKVNSWPLDEGLI